MNGRNEKLIDFANKLATTFEVSPLLPQDFGSRLRSSAEIDDFEFDKILPARYRFVSNIHWTSIQVARTIARRLNLESTQRFVDIGSGVGKLCILLSELTKLEIWGVEQRRHLHEIAETIIKANSITRVNLSHCNMMDIDWREFDIFFFFNPFQEHKLKYDVFAIDQDIHFEEGLFTKCVKFVEGKLLDLPPGKQLITLDGFGGEIPKNWRLVSSEKVVDTVLNHWIKEF